MEEEKLLDEIRSWCDGWCFDNKTALEMLRGYAESYHAKRCSECTRKERKYYPLGQEPNKTYCENCIDFDACTAIQVGMFCEGKNYKPIA